MNILFVQEQGIGNMVMATPAFQALKQLQPDCHLTVYGNPNALEIVKDAPFVDSVITECDDETRYDVILLSIWASGFQAKYSQQWIQAHTDRLISANLNNPDTHESEYHLALVRDLGFDGDAPPPIVPVQPFDSLPDKPYIVLADTCVSREWERKRWKHFPKLAEMLIADGYQVVMTGGEKESAEWNESFNAYPVGTTAFFDLPLAQTAYLLENAEIFVGNDSGPAHISGAVGTESFVIFGATRPTKNTPLGKNVHVIQSQMACSPCQYEGWWQTCRRFECMETLSAEAVYRYIKSGADEAVYRIAPPQPRSPKLVAVMRIKDALPTIRQCLESVSRIADEIVIVDNGSTDGTLAVYDGFKKVKRYAELPASLEDATLAKSGIIQTEGLDEIRDRKVMDALLRDSGADWALFIDADEVLEPEITRERVQDWMIRADFNAFWFRHVHFWNDTQHYRIDQRWKPRHRRGLWRVTPESHIVPDVRVNPGIVYNLKGKQLTTDYAVWHYGHMDPERNAKRQALWRSIDNPDHPDFSGMSYDHMTDETYLQLAEWDDTLPIEQRKWGNPSMLIVMLHGGGDCLMLTPTLRALRARDPNLEISVMGLEKIDERDFKTHQLFEGNPHITRYYPSSIDHHPEWWYEKGFRERTEPVIRKDINALSQLTSFDTIVTPTLQEHPHLHRIDRLAMQFGVADGLDRRMELNIPLAEKRWALHRLAHLAPDATQLVSVHRFCGHPPKSYDWESTKAVCEGLVDKGHTVILWDQDEREIEHEPEPISMDGVINMRGLSDKLTIHRSAAILELCSLHIGADSMPMHIASALGVPTIGIFDKTRPHETAPMHSDSVIVATRRVISAMHPPFYEANQSRIVNAGETVSHQLLLEVAHGLLEQGQFEISSIQKRQAVFPTNCVYDRSELFHVQKYLKPLDDFIAKCEGLGLIHNPLKWFDYAPLLKMLQGKTGLKVLDVGGGRSVFGLFLASLGHRVVSIEPDSEANAVRSEAARQLRADMQFYEGTIFDLPASLDACFDAISCISTLEHVLGDVATTIEMSGRLSPNGLLQVTTDFYHRYIEYPDANREIVIDRESGHCDSRIYDKAALHERIINPLAEAGCHLIGDTDFEAIDITNPDNLPVRGLYTFARMFFRKDGP